MAIAVSLPKKTAFIQSRFQSGPQRVCLHTENTPSKGPKRGDKRTRGPPNRTGISLKPAAPSLPSPRSGVSHGQHPPNAISNSLRNNGSDSTMRCSTTSGHLQSLTRCVPGMPGDLRVIV